MDAPIAGYALFCGPDLILSQDGGGAAKGLPIFESLRFPDSGLNAVEGSPAR